MEGKIRIMMEGGIIQGIQNIPKGVVIEVYDYDVEGQDLDHPNMTKDENGDDVFVNTWTSEDDATHALRGARR